MLIVVAGCGGDSTSVGSSVIDISITPSPASIGKGVTKELSEIFPLIEAIDSSGKKTQILPNQCHWIVSNITIAKIVGYKLTGISPGTTKLTITFSGVSKDITLNVL
jgi:hypothetical protein